MALPRKLKGYRKIAFQGQSYRWIVLPGARQGILKVIPDPAGQTLQVTLTDWADPWLQSRGREVPHQQLQITPGVVASMLHLALQGGWQPQQPQAPFLLSFTQQQLMMLSK